MAVHDSSIASKVFDQCNIVLMVGVVFVTFYPMYYIAIVSLSDGKEVIFGTIRFWPRGVNLEAYKFVLKDPWTLRTMFNSVYYTSFGTLVNICVTAMCAYPLSRKSFSGRRVITIAATITMLFSGGLIPLYLVVLKLGMINTVWALVLVPAINTWYMFIMRTFFQGLPESFHESAKIDGANDIVILLRIVVPLAKPVFATLILFYAVFHWNSYFQAMIFLNEKRKFPLQLILRSVLVAGRMEFTNEIGSASDYMVIEKTIKYAIIMVSTLPIVLVYPFLQKYFVKGIMVGALKG